jgi:hypothetical protein
MSMPQKTDHNRLLAIAAKQILSPIGCKQKGRSRLWYDDHLWWIGVIEFQPSSWGRGTYLNVGAMWLWNAKDHWSFDEGNRIEPFREVKDDGQFSAAATELAKRAVAEALSLRQRFDTVSAAAEYLSRKDGKTIWGHYHAANALAVAGEMEAARAELDVIRAQEVHAPWVAELQQKAATLLNQLESVEATRQTLRVEIVKARSLLNLAPLQEDKSLWV